METGGGNSLKGCNLMNEWIDTNRICAGRISALASEKGDSSAAKQICCICYSITIC